MATQVYTTEEVELQDGTNVTLRPLPIKTLRVFMKLMDEFGKSVDEEEGLEILLDAAALSISKQKAEYYNKDKKRVSVREADGKPETVNLTDGGSTESFEEVVDMPTIYKILEVCGGVKLNDPNLLAAAMEQMERNGQTST